MWISTQASHTEPTARGPCLPSPPVSTLSLFLKVQVKGLLLLEAFYDHPGPGPEKCFPL